MIFLILLLIVLITVVWAVKTSNNIKRMEIKVDEAFSGIEVALTKRYDMLTKMLDVCKGFMKHESELFSKVISLRRGMSLGEMGEADREMGELTGRLFAVAENYPELRSAQVFAIRRRRAEGDGPCRGKRPPAGLRRRPDGRSGLGDGAAKDHRREPGGERKGEVHPHAGSGYLRTRPDHRQLGGSLLYRRCNYGDWRYPSPEGIVCHLEGKIGGQGQVEQIGDPGGALQRL